jgi:hypothetical protein
VGAEEGYRFESWTGDVGTIDDVNAASTTITMNDNYSIAPNFIAQYVLTIDSTGGGEVTAPGEGTFTYDEGTVVNLEAYPPICCRFVNWTGDVGTVVDVNDATTTITINGDYSIMGDFAYSDDETNVVLNPGCENGLDFWSSTGGTATYESNSSIRNAGSYSAKGIETNKDNLGRLYQDVTAIVSPGARYKIGGWIKTEAVDGAVVIALDYVGSGGWSPPDGYVEEIGHVSGTTDWTYYESDEFLLPPMPADCVAAWFLFDFNRGQGSAWWDDVCLTKTG